MNILQLFLDFITCFVLLFGFIQFSFNDAYQKFFLAQFVVIDLLVPCKKGFDALEKFLGYLKCQCACCHVSDSLRFLKKCGYGLLDELRCGDALSFQFISDLLMQVVRNGDGQFAHFSFLLLCT